MSISLFKHLAARLQSLCGIRPHRSIRSDSRPMGSGSEPLPASGFLPDFFPHFLPRVAPRIFPLWQHAPVRRALLAATAVSVFGAVTAFGVAPLAPDAALLPTQRVTQLLPSPSLQELLDANAAQTETFLHEERIRRGDTVAALLDRLQIEDPVAVRFLRQHAVAQGLYQLRPGRLVQAETDRAGRLMRMRYLHTPAVVDDQSASAARALIVERIGDDFDARDAILPNERRIEFGTGTIRTSLFGATDEAGVPDAIAIQIAEILSGDIDFYRDLRRGDRFRVIYEMYYQGAEVVRPGRVLAVEFVNAGKSYQAVWYAQAGTPGEEVRGNYYDFAGQSLRRAFLRSPLEFSRISSGFGARMHPIHKTWRAHKGVDYAAPSGTSVRTTSDGVIDFIGKQGGYGNVVIVKHQSKYSTVYAHLSRFAKGLRKGTRVSQGQVIGHVGMTGWATGPHLHYEFRVAGVARNPLTVAMPQAEPIPPARLADFRTHTADWHRHIDLLRSVDSPVEILASTRTGGA